ncbi:MAG: hydroxymethylglutaryl-CoA lyase [Legionellales bacterium]|nr:hydroxymethylglutaryl-CoA lyase [Legionellales bacterium]
MNHPPEVTVIEVGPRDGLQNEPSTVPTSTKVDFINLLSASGLQHIEVTSFVSAKAIPQLADNEAVFRAIQKPAGLHFSVLIPNERGMQEALAVGVKDIALFTAASETFNQHNIHCSIDESLQRFKPVMTLARKEHLRVRAYISCVLGCPYEGAISPKEVMKVAERLMDFGVDEISLGDTIGVGTPKQTIALVKDITQSLPISQLAMHFHDTYGQAIANIYAAFEHGVKRFDSYTAGLGGCPYARGASGNVATEDLLYLMHGLGIETGIDIYQIVAAGDMICKALGRKSQSKVANALLANLG